MSQISAATRIKDIVKKHPAAVKVLEKHGMMCTHCGGSESEILRNAAQNHGVPLETLLKELKAAAKK